MAPVVMPSSGLITSISQDRNQIFKSQLGYAMDVGGLVVFKSVGPLLPSGIASWPYDSSMTVVPEFFSCSAIDQK